MGVEGRGGGGEQDHGRQVRIQHPVLRVLVESAGNMVHFHVVRMRLVDLEVYLGSMVAAMHPAAMQPPLNGDSGRRHQSSRWDGVVNLAGGDKQQLVFQVELFEQTSAPTSGGADPPQHPEVAAAEDGGVVKTISEENVNHGRSAGVRDEDAADVRRETTSGLHSAAGHVVQDCYKTTPDADEAGDVRGPEHELGAEDWVRRYCRDTRGFYAEKFGISNYLELHAQDLPRYPIRNHFFQVAQFLEGASSIGSTSSDAATARAAASTSGEPGGSTHRRRVLVHLPLRRF